MLDKEKIKERVLELFKKGYIQADIARETRLSDKTIRNYKNELIKEGRLKEDEVAKSVDGTYNRASIHKEKIPQVVDLLKQGISPREIKIRLNISLKTYMSIIKYLKRNELISKEEFEKALGRSKDKETKLLEDKINNGYDLSKIIKENPSISKENIEVLLDSLIEEGKIASNITQLKENKKHDKKIQSNTSSIKSRKRKKKKLDEKQLEEIENVKSYIEKGYSEYEITNFLGRTLFYLTNLIKQYSEENNWYSKEELLAFKTERKKREDEEEKKKDEERIAGVREWIKKRKELEERLSGKNQIERSESKRKKQNYSPKKEKVSERLDERYEKFKKKAIQGYNEYISGDNKAVNDFNDFLNTLILMEEKNIEPDINGIKLAGTIIAECPELAKKKYIKYIILQYNKYFGEGTTIIYINRMIREQEGNIDVKKLEEVKIKIHEIEQKNKIQKMINQGKNINEIAKSLNISYQSAVNLYKKEIDIHFDER